MYFNSFPFLSNTLNSCLGMVTPQEHGGISEGNLRCHSLRRVARLAGNAALYPRMYSGALIVGYRSSSLTAFVCASQATTEPG